MGKNGLFWFRTSFCFVDVYIYTECYLIFTKFPHIFTVLCTNKIFNIIKILKLYINEIYTRIQLLTKVTYFVIFPIHSVKLSNMLIKSIISTILPTFPSYLVLYIVPCVQQLPIQCFHHCLGENSRYFKQE